MRFGRARDVVVVADAATLELSWSTLCRAPTRSARRELLRGWGRGGDCDYGGGCFPARTLPSPARNAQIANSDEEFAISTVYRVRADGLEPSTSGLRVRCSTIELRPRCSRSSAPRQSIDLQFSVSPKGFEPLTYGFEARRSIQLSYGPWFGRSR